MQIKVRVWDKTTKIMKYDVKDLNLNDVQVAMLGTGVMDSEGKEIYVGDIIYGQDNLFDSLPEEYRKVSLEDGEYRVYNHLGNAPLKIWGPSSKIVGNIYQNPKLIQA